MHLFKAYLSSAIAALCLPFVLVAQPVISSFTPITGKPGDVITLTGANFNTTQANNIVFFGATRATVTAATATSITATVPVGATYAPITLLNTGTGLAASSLNNFTPTYSPAETAVTATGFLLRQDFTTRSRPRSVAIGDLDGDGKPDLAITAPNSVSIYRNISNTGSIGIGSFAARQDFTTGSSPVSIAIGDLDGDGKPDLAVANSNSNSVSVFRNTSISGTLGAGSFAARQDFVTDRFPSSVAIGDLDGDGKLDLAVANEGSNSVSVYRNISSIGSIGANSFSPKQDFTTGTAPSAVVIGDLDGDGKPDWAVANKGLNNLSVYRNISSPGNLDTSSFAARQDFTTGTNPFSIAIGDLDGDGKPDLAIANISSNSVSVFRNTSSTGSINAGSFAAKVDFTTGASPSSVAFGDLDGDGKPDLVLANNGSHSVSVFRNISGVGTIGIGSFAARQDFATGISPASVAIGDLDGDAKPDLAVTNFFSNSVSVLRNEVIPPPTITGFTPLTGQPGDVLTISGANFDTIAANNIVFFGATRATLTSTTATSVTLTVPIGATYAPITLLRTGSGLSASSLSNFTPTYNPLKIAITPTDFLPKQDFTAGANPQSVAIGDLDGDGKPDLAVANYGSHSVSVYRNISNTGIIGIGSFADKVDFATGAGPYSVTIGDLDGDGKPDLAVANISSNSVSVYRNTASTGSIDGGSFYLRQDFVTGWWPSSVSIGDLDGDGKPELAVTNQGSDSVSVFRNTFSIGTLSSSSLAPKQDFATGGYPSSIAIGDMDGDGKLDLVVANSGPNTFSVLRNISSVGIIDMGSFATRQDFATGEKPSSVAIGDLDGDGKPDLAVANVISNTVSVFRNTSSIGTIGAGSFTVRQDFTTGRGPTSVAMGDLDGDGKPDLATANLTTGTISVFRNTSNTGSIGASSLAAKIDFSTAASPYSAVVGDLDGDGMPDLAVANYSANSISVLRNVVFPPPIITTYTPISGKPSDSVTLTGINFNTSAANNIVYIGATRATVTAATTTTMKVTVPIGATYGPISVLDTKTLLAANSLGNFTPTYNPSKTAIRATDFLPRQDYTTGTSPYASAIGDLDGDGKPDLAVVNFSSNSVSIYRNISSSGSIGASSFAVREDFTTGSNPYSVAIGDLDGDGKSDLAVANYGSNSVSVFRNTSSVGVIDNGSFAARQDFTTGSGPRSVAIGDIDGDGKPDLAVANEGLNTFSVFRNTSGTINIGYVSFAARQDFTTGTYPCSVAISDLDRDGKPDLAVANLGSDYVSVFRNTTSIGRVVVISFAAKQDFVTGSNPSSVAIGDLDRDGKPDLAVTSFVSNTVSVYRNTSNNGTIDAGSFAARQDFTTGSGPISVAVGDLDGDGKPDLAVANNGPGSVSVFRNMSSMGSLGSGSFAARQDFTTATGTRSVAIGDLDGDAKPDLAVANSFSNSVSVLRNADIPPPTITTFAPISGKPGDVVTLTGTNFDTTAANNIVFFGATKATVTAATATSATLTVPVGATYAPITLLDTDTRLAGFSLRNFTPTYSPAKTAIAPADFLPRHEFFAGFYPRSVAIGDLDGDGKPDLAVANSGSNSISVHRNISNAGSIDIGSFAAKVDFVTGEFPSSVAIADLDGDGKPDLAVENYGSNFVSVFRNTSSIGSIDNSSFQPEKILQTGQNPGSVAIGDLDGDGKPDLVVLNGLNTVSVFRNTSSIGTGSFTARQDFETGLNPSRVAIGDLDGDGRLDLAVANNGSNTFSVFRNTSNTGSIDASSFAARQDFAAGTSPSSLAIGDLDGDGKPDLAVLNRSVDAVLVYRNTCSVGIVDTGSFAVTQDFATGSNPVSVAIGDLDGDSKPDLAVANLWSHDVSVFRNTSSTGTIGIGSFAAKQDFAAGELPVSVAIGDLDGDGKPDLTVANLASSFSVLRNANIVYTFTGSGNWNNPANWSGNIVPSSIIQANVHIVIDPAGSGECILNVPVTVPKSSSITVAPGKRFIIQGNLTITQ